VFQRDTTSSFDERTLDEGDLTESLFAESSDHPLVGDSPGEK